MEIVEIDCPTISKALRRKPLSLFPACGKSVDNLGVFSTGYLYLVDNLGSFSTGFPQFSKVFHKFSTGWQGGSLKSLQNLMLCSLGIL